MAFYDFTDRTPMWGNVGSELNKMLPGYGQGTAPDLSEVGFWGGGGPMMAALQSYMKNYESQREAGSRERIAQMTGSGHDNTALLNALVNMSGQTSHERTADRQIEANRGLRESQQAFDWNKLKYTEGETNKRAKDALGVKNRQLDIIGEKNQYDKAAGNIEQFMPIATRMVPRDKTMTTQQHNEAIYKKALELRRDSAMRGAPSGGATDPLEFQVKGISVSPEEMAAYEGGDINRGFSGQPANPDGTFAGTGNYGESGTVEALKRAYPNQSPMYQNREIQDNIAAGYQKPFQTAAQLDQEQNGNNAIVGYRKTPNGETFPIRISDLGKAKNQGLFDEMAKTDYRGMPSPDKKFKPGWMDYSGHPDYARAEPNEDISDLGFPSDRARGGAQLPSVAQEDILRNPSLSERKGYNTAMQGLFPTVPFEILDKLLSGRYSQGNEKAVQDILPYLVAGIGGMAGNAINRAVSAENPLSRAVLGATRQPKAPGRLTTDNAWENVWMKPRQDAGGAAYKQMLDSGANPGIPDYGKQGELGLAFKEMLNSGAKPGIPEYSGPGPMTRFFETPMENTTPQPPPAILRAQLERLAQGMPQQPPQATRGLPQSAYDPMERFFNSPIAPNPQTIDPAMGRFIEAIKLLKRQQSLEKLFNESRLSNTQGMF